MSVIVNFKSVVQGKNAETLAKLMESIDPNRLIAVVSPFDVDAVSRAAPKLKIWVQSINPNTFRPLTGNLNINTAIERGACGALLNHVECPVGALHVSKVVKYKPDGFSICVCANDVVFAEQTLTECSPEYIAVEPPQFIGKSASMKSDAVKNIVEKIGHKTNVICGAGIRSPYDVARISVEGAKGVLVSSCVVNSKNQESVIRGLLSGLQKVTLY